jgi:paraquat-inducible protein B
MSRKVNPAVVGAFVVGAIAIAVVSVMVFSSGKLFARTHKFVLSFDQSVAGLRTGAPVKFRGVEVGTVVGIYFDLGTGHPSEDNSIPVIIEMNETLIRERGSDAQLDDPEWIQRVIDAGMRAQLRSESMVTGRLYVALDLQPGTPATFRLGTGAPYPEIPTIPTAMAAIEQNAAAFISELEEIPLDSIGRSVAEMLDGLNRLVNSPHVADAIVSLDVTLRDMSETAASLRDLLEAVDQRVVPVAEKMDSTRIHATATLDEMRATLAAIRVVLEPGSPMTVQLERALDDIGATARALEELMAYLERNPAALVRGRSTEENQ